MKRSPLQRRTPLQGKGNLKRGPVTRKAPPPGERHRVETRKAEARADGHSIPWGDVRHLIHARSEGRCEVCGNRLSFRAMEAHHRRTRAIGPDCPCNALALCQDCHHVKVHGHPEEARALGRIISRHDRNAPSIQPVRLIHGLVLLACDGSVKTVRPNDLT